jgi:DUF1680 family protein
MKRLLLTPLLLLFACSNNSNSKPDNLLSKEQMVDLLTDLHLAEAKIQTLNFRSADSGKVAYLQLEEQVFANHKINKKDYDSSFSYYNKNLAELNEIYEKTIDSIGIRQSKMDVIK